MTTWLACKRVTAVLVGSLGLTACHMLPPDKMERTGYSETVPVASSPELEWNKPVKDTNWSKSEPLPETARISPYENTFYTGVVPLPLQKEPNTSLYGKPAGIPRSTARESLGSTLAAEPTVRPKTGRFCREYRRPFAIRSPGYRHRDTLCR